MQNLLLSIFRVLPIAVGLACIFGLSLGESPPASAQITGTGTGWCSDYSGRNFRCDSGGSTSSSGGYGGGGCAHQANYNEQLRQNNVSMHLQSGDRNMDKKDFAGAAFNFKSTWDDDPSNDRARKRYGTALNELGILAYSRYENLNAALYFERALAVKPESAQIRRNLNAAESPVRDCSSCGRAVINDVAYGLDNSAWLQKYVEQATTNYANCTRKLSCAGDSGREFYLLMRDTCLGNFKDAAGLEGCVRQGVSQYR